MGGAQPIVLCDIHEENEHLLELNGSAEPCELMRQTL